MNVALHQELAKVGLRYRRLLLRTGLAACFLALAAAGVFVLSWARGSGHAVPGVALVLLLLVPLVVIPLLARALRAVRNPVWIAHGRGRRSPPLAPRWGAALGQPRREGSEPLGFPQQTVIAETREPPHPRRWDSLVSARALR